MGGAEELFVYSFREGHYINSLYSLKELYVIFEKQKKVSLLRSIA